ncbi:MAG: hypothetical protein H7175_06290 [Burkholderiales bacterium]|nr:hypothetical protein [Anaerolineae bacterium]
MKLKSCHVLIVVLLLFAASVKAQNSADDVTWYWAWRESDGAVFAYNANGDVNTLLENTIAYHLTRVDDQIGLAMLGNSESYALYKLTPTTSIQISERFEGILDQDEIYVDGFEVAISHFPYVVMTAWAYRLSEVWLVNVEANTLERLDVRVDYPGMCVSSLYGGLAFESCMRFSEDGQKLRYIARSDAYGPYGSGNLWTLRERILSSGEEREVYRQTIPRPDVRYGRVECHPDQYADKWLCESHIEYDQLPYIETQHWLLFSDGSTLPLVSGVGNEYMRWNVYLSDRNLIFLDEYCEISCHIVAYLYQDARSIIFTLPENLAPKTTRGYIHYLRLLDDKRLLIGRSEGYYILDIDGSLRSLGRTLCCHLFETISDDNQWAALLDQEGILRLWNLTEDQIEFETKGYWWSTFFVENGFFANHEPGDQMVYSFESRRLLELPQSCYRYFDISSNDVLLCEGSSPGSDPENSIYRYDSIAGEFDLLIEGGQRF